MRITTIGLALFMVFSLWVFSVVNTVTYFTATCLSDCGTYKEILDLPRYIYDIHLLWHALSAFGFIAVVGILFELGEQKILYVPNPFQKIIEARREKRALLASIKELHLELRKAPDHQLDSLVKKLQIMENQL